MIYCYPLPLPELPIKHGSLNQNGSGKPGNTLETPTGLVTVVIFRWQWAGGCVQAHQCHFDLKIAVM